MDNKLTQHVFASDTATSVGSAPGQALLLSKLMSSSTWTPVSVGIGTGDKPLLGGVEDGE